MRISSRLSASAAVEAYLASRQPWSFPISTAKIVAHLREHVPDCEHTDQELVQLIAIIGVRQRCPLSFDGPFAAAMSPAPPMDARG